MKNSPKLSVLCITYNHEKFIKQTLESFMMQKTDFDFEVIIGEDCSTDNTREIIKEFEQKYPHIIKPIYRDKNIGAMQNSIDILYRANGDYIAFCEGDDYWTDPYKLQKQVSFLEANPEYSLCWCRFKTLDENTGEFQVDENDVLFQNGKDCVVFDFERFYTGWHIGMQTLVFRKCMHDPSYYSLYTSPKDIHLLSHLLLNGKGACLSFFGAVYRKHGAGIYSGVSELQNAKVGYRCYKEIYNNNKQIYYLKLKYIKFIQRYIDVLCAHKKYGAAFLKAVELLFHNRNVKYFMEVTRKILFKK